MQKSWNINNKFFDSDKYNNMLSVNPWAGHREFIYDLIVYLQPKNFVELGTHYGCSFFSVAQAVKDFQLSTQLYGIDTWQGEEHAGKYDEEVIELVKFTIEKEYSSQKIELLRMYFNEAVKYFPDSSIDVLHIDGLHTYEATKEDFLTWLPKINQNGVVIFHDIANYTSYGSHDYWLELKKQYKFHFEFDHSWGLGILFPNQEEVFNSLNSNQVLKWLEYYKYKSEYKLLKIQNLDKEKMIDERDAVIESQAKMIDERDEYIKKLESMVNEFKNK